MRPKVLYHGSPRKLRGGMITPKLAKGLGGKHERLKGVYATHVGLAAILMAIISDKNVKLSSLNLGNKKEGLIHKGWPKRKYVYLYYLQPKNFKNTPKGSWQWISKKEVKPIKTEKIKVEDYMHLIRRPTQKEKKRIKEIEKKNK